MFICINHEFKYKSNPIIHSDDRGFLLGDGVFTTLKSINGNLIHFNEHFTRLKNNAQQIFLPFKYKPEELISLCTNLITLNELSASSAVLRITLSRGSGARGINLPPEPHPTLLISAVKHLTEASTASKLCITPFIRNEHSPLSNLKTLNYLDSIMAREYAKQNGFDDGILLNTKHNISETSIANLFFIFADKIITPPLEDGIVDGIIRKNVIQICNNLNLNLLEQSIRLDEALGAQEVFQTNCVLGIKNVAQINNSYFNYGENGALTTKILEAYKKSVL